MGYATHSQTMPSPRPLPSDGRGRIFAGLVVNFTVSLVGRHYAIKALVETFPLGVFKGERTIRPTSRHTDHFPVSQVRGRLDDVAVPGLSSKLHLDSTA